MRSNENFPQLNQNSILKAWTSIDRISEQLRNQSKIPEMQVVPSSVVNGVGSPRFVSRCCSAEPLCVVWAVLNPNPSSEIACTPRPALERQPRAATAGENPTLGKLAGKGLNPTKGKQTKNSIIQLCRRFWKQQPLSYWHKDLAGWLKSEKEQIHSWNNSCEVPRWGEVRSERSVNCTVWVGDKRCWSPWVTTGSRHCRHRRYSLVLLLPPW